jgi:hypothetical protein
MPCLTPHPDSGDLAESHDIQSVKRPKLQSGLGHLPPGSSFVPQKRQWLFSHHNKYASPAIAVISGITTATASTSARFLIEKPAP